MSNASREGAALVSRRHFRQPITQLPCPRAASPSLGLAEPMPSGYRVPWLGRGAVGRDRLKLVLPCRGRSWLAVETYSAEWTAARQTIASTCRRNGQGPSSLGWATPLRRSETTVMFCPGPTERLSPRGRALDRVPNLDGPQVGLMVTATTLGARSAFFSSRLWNPPAKLEGRRWRKLARTVVINIGIHRPSTGCRVVG
jgi:hypothetical protein